jgi:hypothetical protein
MKIDIDKIDLEEIERTQVEIQKELKKLISDESRKRLNKWYKMLEEIKGGKLPCKNKKKK